ncbi:MAG: hypothetical protein QM757_03890 [Paludibaculum sp.]
MARTWLHIAGPAVLAICSWISCPPYQLSGTGVVVKVGGLLAPVEYISPEVVTFLVPSELRAGPVNVVLTYNFLSGPTIRVQLLPAAPAWFLMETGFVLARHSDSMEWVDELSGPPRRIRHTLRCRFGRFQAHPALPRIAPRALPSGRSRPVSPADRWRTDPSQQVRAMWGYALGFQVFMR